MAVVAADTDVVIVVAGDLLLLLLSTFGVVAVVVAAVVTLAIVAVVVVVVVVVGAGVGAIIHDSISIPRNRINRYLILLSPDSITPTKYRWPASWLAHVTRRVVLLNV